MAMTTPLNETGNVLSLKHSNHILICRFMIVFVNAGAKLQKDCHGVEKNDYFCGLQNDGSMYR
jgi:hypothetical protein